MEEQILTFPNFKNEFILDTYASFDTIGVVVSQEYNNRNGCVTAYGSHEK